MSNLAQCPIAEVCEKYTNGTKRRPHHMRLVVPCKGWMDYSCDMGLQLYFWIKGEYPACKVKK